MHHVCRSFALFPVCCLSSLSGAGKPFDITCPEHHQGENGIADVVLGGLLCGQDEKGSALSNGEML